METSNAADFVSLEQLIQKRMIEEEWFNVGVQWVCKCDLITAGIALLSYRQQRPFFRSSSGHYTCEFGCLVPDCAAKIKFLFSQTSQAWSVKVNDPHSENCNSLSADPVALRELWALDQLKLEPLSAQTTAAICLGRLREMDPGIHFPHLQPREVRKVIEDLGLLPPFYSQQPRWKDRLNNLASRVCSRIKDLVANDAPLTTPATLHGPAESSGQELRYLTSFAEKFRALDPDNQVCIDVDASNRYLCCYVVFGPVKRMATHEFSTFQLDLDATHFHHARHVLACPGNLRAVVYTDATGSYYPLIIGHDSREESEDSWRFLVDLLFSLFPNPEKLGIASDRDKGLLTVLQEKVDQTNCGEVFCHAHLLRNAQAQIKADKTLVKRLFQSMAMASTIADFDRHRANAQAALPELITYLDNLPRERYAVAFFPVQRWGITSNPVESFWSLLNSQAVREMNNIVDIFITSYRHLIQQLATTRCNFSNCLDSVSRYASRQLQTNMSHPGFNEWQVSNIRVFSGTVTLADGRLYRCDLAARTCPCTKAGEHTFACAHLLKLAQHLELLYSPKTLVAPCVFHNNWRKSFDSEAALDFEFIFSENAVENSFAPPIYTGKRGRPRGEKPKRNQKELSKSTRGALARAFGYQGPFDNRSPEEIFQSRLTASADYVPPAEVAPTETAPSSSSRSPGSSQTAPTSTRKIRSRKEKPAQPPPTTASTHRAQISSSSSSKQSSRREVASPAPPSKRTRPRGSSASLSRPARPFANKRIPSRGER